MKPALDNGTFLILAAISGYFVDQSMFHRYSSGPVSLEAKSKRFRFARSGKRSGLNGMDQLQDPGRRFPAGFQPVSKVFPAMFGKPGIH